jgi:hypothetical protein
MEDGRSIEVGTVGKESMVGAVLLLEVDTVPHHYFVQIAGRAYRVEASAFINVAEKNSELRRTALRREAGHLTQAMQAAACNDGDDIPEFNVEDFDR